MTDGIKVLLQMQSGFLQLESTLFTFPQSVRSVNSIHIQFYIKITIATETYDMRIITKNVGF
jgi:hypothetical protein